MCILYALRKVRKSANNPYSMNRDYWQRGLYIGPSKLVEGAIKVAVITRKKLVRILHTTIFKGVSDGGDVDTYSTIYKYVSTTMISDLQEQVVPVEKPSNSDSLTASEDPILTVSASTESRGELRGANVSEGASIEVDPYSN